MALLKLTDPWFPGFYGPSLAGLLSQRCAGNTPWRLTNGRLYGCQLKSRPTRECQGILMPTRQELKSRVTWSRQGLVWKAAGGGPSPWMGTRSGCELRCRPGVCCRLGGPRIIRNGRRHGPHLCRWRPQQCFVGAAALVKTEHSSYPRFLSGENQVSLSQLAQRDLFICLGTSVSDCGAQKQHDAFNSGSFFRSYQGWPPCSV